jgi:cation diffusion facilitator CzcD-associated flavoprotein CzcO
MVPDFALPGILEFKGPTFHTSRWDYAATGCSAWDLSLRKLKDKRVAIIGTSASAVQAVPHLARRATHLYVFQRTPPSVDYLDHRTTDTEGFRKEVAATPG